MKRISNNFKIDEAENATVMRSILDGLYNVADIIGLGDFTHSILSSISGTKPLSPSRLQDLLNEIIGKSRSLSNSKQMMVNSQLESLSSAAQAIPTFKTKISEAARRVKSNLNSMNYNLNEAETHLNNATNSLAQYSALSNRQQSSKLGQNLISNMMSQANKARDKFDYENKGEENV